jgi:hypothetical protein
VNKTQNEKLRRQQVLKDVQSCILDEHEAALKIKKMEELKQAKRDRVLQGRDFMLMNMEKASVWGEIQVTNMTMMGAGRELEIQMAQRRKEQRDQKYVKGRMDYQCRWETYRRQIEELV